VSGLQTCDRLEAASIFVPDRKAVQEIFHRVQAGVFEVGRSAWTDTLEELQRRRKRLI
jgi:hypothetical protein